MDAPRPLARFFRRLATAVGSDDAEAAAEARRDALAHVAAARGWTTETEGRGVPASLSGKHDDRAVELAYVEASEGSVGEPWTRIRVRLGSDPERALINWDPKELGLGPLLEPARSAQKDASQATDLPSDVRTALGDTYEWLIENSARICLAQGSLYVDHPETIDDGGTLDELVVAAVEHAARLDEVLSSL